MTHENTTQARPLVLLAGASVTRGEAKLLRGVDFALQPGARWAVLGENGAGKTTLLRLLRGDILPDAGGRREYTMPGQETQPTPLGLRQRLAQVSADMQDAFTVHEWPATGIDVVLSGFEDTALLYGEPGPERRGRAAVLLAELGLAELGRRRMRTLSTGEARKMLLARALVGEPEALLLDECLEGLDVPARQDFLTLLDQVAVARPGLALLFCSHRLDELPACLSQGMVLRAGRIVASGPLTELAAKLHAEARAGEASTPVAKTPTAASELDMDFVLRVTNASLEVEGVRLLDNVQWTIRSGEHWAVLGANGAGKSTLLGLLAGQVWPSAVGAAPGSDGPPGTVEYGFAQGQTVDEARRRIGLVSGALQAGFPYDLRVEEAVWTGLDASLDVFAKPDEAGRQRAEEWLKFFGLETLRHRRVKSLSRGQMRRVLLARAVVGNPALLLLDEPMAGLDSATRRATRELLGRLAATGLTLVMVTHHERDLPERISHVLALKSGRVVFCGERGEYAAMRKARRETDLPHKDG